MCTRFNESLNILRRESWSEYWTQGGVFDFISPRIPSVYTLASIVIIAGKPVEITACELGERDCERTIIYLSVEDEVGTEASERHFRPHRERVTRFPQDLDLRVFLDSANTVEVLRDEHESDSRIVGLLVRNEVNELLIVPDEDVPESISITMNRSFIHGYLDI